MAENNGIIDDDAKPMDVDIMFPFKTFSNLQMVGMFASDSVNRNIINNLNDKYKNRIIENILALIRDDLERARSEALFYDMKKKEEEEIRLREEDERNLL